MNFCFEKKKQEDLNKKVKSTRTRNNFGKVFVKIEMKRFKGCRSLNLVKKNSMKGV